MKTFFQSRAARPSVAPAALPDGSLDQVAGGLNPQPLPPRWSFDLSPFKVRGAIPVKQVVR